MFQHDLTDMERKVMTVILTRMWAACATDRVHDTVKVDAALDERHADGSTERVPLSASNDVTVDAGWTAIEHTSKTDGAEKKPANRIPDSLGKGPLSQSGSPSSPRACPHRRNHSRRPHCCPPWSMRADSSRTAI